MHTADGSKFSFSDTHQIIAFSSIGGCDTDRFVRVRLGFYRDKDMFSDKTDIKTDNTDKTDIKTDKTDMPDIENPKVKLQIQGLLQLQKEVIVIIQSQYMDGLQR